MRGKAIATRRRRRRKEKRKVRRNTKGTEEVIFIHYINIHLHHITVEKGNLLHPSNFTHFKPL